MLTLYRIWEEILEFVFLIPFREGIEFWMVWDKPLSDKICYLVFVLFLLTSVLYHDNFSPCLNDNLLTIIITNRWEIVKNYFKSLYSLIPFMIIGIQGTNMPKKSHLVFTPIIYKSEVHKQTKKYNQLNGIFKTSNNQKRTKCCFHYFSPLRSNLFFSINIATVSKSLHRPWPVW